MDGASGQQLSRKGRMLMSVDLTSESGPCSAAENHSAAAANTAWPVQLSEPRATPSSHRASSEAVLLHQADRRSSSLASVTSELPRDPSGVSQGSSKVPPLPFAPRAIPAGQSSIPLGPIRQPLQSSLPRNPHYLPRSVPQAPLLQTQSLPSGWAANEVIQIQQQRYQQLTAAQAVGYCQGVKQQPSHRHTVPSLLFTRHQDQSSKQPAAHSSAGSKALHASSSVNTASGSSSGHKRSDPDADSLQPAHTKQRLVQIAELQHSSAPAAQGLIRFRCGIADVLDAHWPDTAKDQQLRPQGSAVASPANPADTASRDSSSHRERAIGKNAALGRGSSRRLLSMSCCEDPADPSALPQPPAANSSAMAPRTSAFAALSIGSETMAGGAMLLPPQPTTQSVDQATAAARGADWMYGPQEPALQSSLTNSLSCGFQNPSMTRLQHSGSGQAQAEASPSTGFPLSSFPQVMTQLLAEPSLHARVAAYQPPASAQPQQDVQAPEQGVARPQKRARQGQQCLAFPVGGNEREGWVCGGPFTRGISHVCSVLSSSRHMLNARQDA